ncbi:MAG: hypothetical protein ABW194_00985 [Novosphingobium sp.]
MNRRLARLGAALALVPLLGGCIAVAALPVLAGGAMVTKGNLRIRAATPRPKRPPAGRVTENVGARALGSAGAAGTLPGGLVRTTLTALPAPSGADLAPWEAFVGYALDHAARVREGAGRSVLLANASSLGLAQRRDCQTRDPAVIVDLDPDAAPFAPGASARAGLAQSLARLRAAGVAVLWITERQASDVAVIGEALVASGLDAQAADPLLLVRSPSDRKQLLRQQANRDVCVVAIAGDRKSDFDELFDYLRDPNSAVGPESLIGSGWFIVPTPFE